MIVCICRKIFYTQFVCHERASMGFDKIQFELGVAAQCGKCESYARDVVAQRSASWPVANIQPAENFPGGSIWQTSAFI